MQKFQVLLLLLSALLATSWAAAAFEWSKVHDQDQLLGRGSAAKARDTPIMDPNGLAKNKGGPEAEKNAQFWYDLAHEEVARRTSQPHPDTRKAKNIIMFLGDGMSLTTVTAARILQGQLKGNTGEEDALSFEKFPYTGLSKTYCSNAQVPDSACTATAYLCGVKTNIVALGITAAVNFNNCSGSEDTANQVSSIASWAQAAGKATGIVTTTTLTHASPSGAYAHATNRFFECDTDIVTYGEGQNDPATCTDIATQLITKEPGKNFDVMLGGGMGKFLPKTITDKFGKAGERSDGVNLLSKWQSLHPEGALAYNRAQLLKLNATRIPRLIGLFESGVMSFNKMADPEQKPTLEEMTKAAIDVVSRNDKGYFIFIEGGLIDYGNHFNKPQLGLVEVHELSKAVQKAVDMTNPEETLIVVTSDHGHPLSIAGYPGRGNSILGLNQHDVDVNGIQYATLNYAAGTDQYLDEHGNRVDLNDKIDDPSFVYPSYIKASIGVHGGDDVGIFATGPQSHLFTGVMQQSTIPHLMAYAGCMGNGPQLCDN